MSGFDGFYGNTALVASLKADIRSGRLSHAYILEGAQGSGKLTLARLIAAAATCKEPNAPCMECISCTKILADQSPDVTLIEAEKDRVQLGVDVIRRLRESAIFAPNDLDRRFYIFPAADTMNVQAQNALLKLLEEPPSFVTFLLLAKSADSLLPTIRSRAPTLRLEPLPDELIREKLPLVSAEAKALSESDAEAFSLVVKRASGSLGAAIELCDAKRAKEILEVYKTATRYLELLSRRSGDLAFYEFAAKLPIKQRPELAELWERLRAAVRDLIAAKLTETFRPLFYPTEDAARNAAASYPLAKLIKLAELFERSRESLERNIGLPLSMSSTAMQALALMSGRNPNRLR